MFTLIPFDPHLVPLVHVIVRLRYHKFVNFLSQARNVYLQAKQINKILVKKQLKPKNFIKTPTYPGGAKAMQKFLRDNKQYPPQALKAKIQGTVSIRYTINYVGKVIQTKIVAGIGHGCDEEAARIVSLLKFTVPKQRNLKAQYHKTVHIHFRLPRRELNTQIQYSITSTEKKPASKSTSYSYQINWK